MKKGAHANLVSILKIAIGSSLFGLGFNLFLVPNGLNAGGISGLSMAIVHLLNRGTVGTVTALINLPLFAIAGIKIGRRFFFGSLVGMSLSALFIDLFAILPAPQVEPLLAALYGAVLCGAGLGTVFTTGASTGGSDIIVRLLKAKWRHVPIGTITMIFDAGVAVVTGLVFGDVTCALYSGVAIFVTGQIIDAVVYRFDYSKIVLIISPCYEELAVQINKRLDRGSTFLNAQGSYSRKDTKVVLTAVKKQQIAELKQLVVDIDPDAFIIVQEAHQVLGDGFARYSKDSL